MALELVTDRKKSDADYIIALKNKGWDSLTAAEKAYWLRGSPMGLYDADGKSLITSDEEALQGRDTIVKGAYNVSDLNRVGAAVQYLADLLNGYGYAVSVTAKQDWELADLSNVSDMESYLDDVQAIKDGFYGTTALPSAMDDLTYTQANNIEELLLEVEEYINLMIAAFRKSGTFKSGQGVILP